MTLKHNTHGDPADLEDELKHLDQIKAEITVANRAPTSSDNGMFWWDWSGSNFYARNKQTGAWVSVALS